METVTPSPEARTRAESARANRPDYIVDCDIHPFVSMENVSKRMSAEARGTRAWTGMRSLSGREPNRYLSPSGPLRLDAVPPKGGLPGSDPDFLIEDHLDKMRIDAAIIAPGQAASVIPWGNETMVSGYLSALNDEFLENWHDRDKRIKMLISVSPHNVDNAVKEVERLADRPGVVGIYIPMAELALGNSNFFKLYDVAQHYGLPVSIHPNGSDGTSTTSPTKAGGVVRTYAEHHAALAHAGQGSFASLVLSGALARFPKLKFVVTEFGFSWVPSLMWRMDRIWEKNGGSNFTLPRKPSEYVLEQCRFTTQPFDEPDNVRDLWPLLDALNAEQTLMFSSDYPHWDTDDPHAILELGRLPAKLRARVAYQTALETYGDRLCLV